MRLLVVLRQKPMNDLLLLNQLARQQFPFLFVAETFRPLVKQLIERWVFLRFLILAQCILVLRQRMTAELDVDLRLWTSYSVCNSALGESNG